MTTQPNDEIVLKPCPLCNGKAYKIYYRKGSGGLPVERVKCGQCKLQTPLRRITANEDVTLLWNTRSSPTCADIVRRLDKFWKYEQHIYSKCQNSYNEGFVDAIEECIAIVREAFKDSTTKGE